MGKATGRFPARRYDQCAGAISAMIASVPTRAIAAPLSLKIQVGPLRRALGDGQGGNRYVITVPGRGYNFVAPLRREERSQASPPPTVASAVMHNLPLERRRLSALRRAPGPAKRRAPAEP
jgi:DNA-binding winged helix-turn-helix (wHTH) protein